MTTTIDHAARAVTHSPGRTVQLRLLEPGDSATVLELFAGMSPRSRELRFLVPKPRLTEADVCRLVDVDQRDHVAVVASHDNRVIGIARFVRDQDAPGSADVAVAVIDEWQRLGIGSVLLRELLRRAVEVGVRRLTLAVASENLAVHRLLRRADARSSLVHSGRGVGEYEVSLDGVLP